MHLLWECPYYADLRADVWEATPLHIFDQLPMCTKICGILTKPPLVVEYELSRATATDIRFFLTPLVEMVRARASPTSEDIIIRTGDDMQYGTYFTWNAGRVTVWTDGACRNQGIYAISAGGCGVFFGSNCVLNVSFPLPGPKHDSPRAELLATLIALLCVDTPLQIVTDHEPMVRNFSRLCRGADILPESNLDIWELIIERVQSKHLDYYSIKHIPGHAGHADVMSGRISELDAMNNCRADELATAAADQIAPSRETTEQYRTAVRRVKLIQHMFLAIWEKRRLLEVPYYEGGVDDSGQYHKPTYRPWRVETQEDGFPRFVRVEPQARAGITPVSSTDVSQGVTAPMAYKPYMPESGYLLEFRWPTEWQIGGRVNSPECHFRWSRSMLAALMVWLSQLRVEKKPWSLSAKTGMTWAQLAIDFECSTGVCIPKAGVIDTDVLGGESKLKISERALSFAPMVRSLLSRFAYIGDAKLTFHNVEKSDALHYLGLPTVAGLLPALQLVSETSVANTVTLWRDQAAQYYRDARAQNNSAYERSAKLRRKSARDPNAGPRSWVPPPIDADAAPLRGKVLDQLQQLNVKGGGQKQKQVCDQIAFSREQDRVSANMLAKHRGGHLIQPVVANQLIECALCAQTAPKGEMLMFSSQICMRYHHVDYIEQFNHETAK